MMPCSSGTARGTGALLWHAEMGDAVLVLSRHRVALTENKLPLRAPLALALTHTHARTHT